MAKIAYLVQGLVTKMKDRVANGQFGCCAGNPRYSNYAHTETTTSYSTALSGIRQCSPQANFKAWWEGKVWVEPVATSTLLYTLPILTSKESLYWRLVGLTCLTCMYAGENTEYTNVICYSRGKTEINGNCFLTKNSNLEWGIYNRWLLLIFPIYTAGSQTFGAKYIFRANIFFVCV